MLTADDLKLLAAVRESGSLTVAAQQLGKATSSVSQAARKLEERLDALLFDRSGYRVALTPAGLELAQGAARLQQESQRITERVRQVARGWESQLRIVSDELVNFDALLPLVADFQQLKSGVQLRFLHECLGGTWEALLEQRADIVVAATNEPPAIASLKWFELGTLQWVFAVAPHHPLAHQSQPVTGEQIAQHTAVVVADTARWHRQRSYGVLPNQTVLAVPGMRHKIAAQKAGLGVGWLPVTRVSQELASGELVALSTDFAREPNVLYVGWVAKKTGPALDWWTRKLADPRLAQRLLAWS